MPKVTISAPVIVQGRQRSPGDTVDISEDQLRRFKRKGWIAEATEHKSTRAKGGPTPKATESKSDDAGKAKAKPKKSSSKSKGKSDKD